MKKNIFKFLSLGLLLSSFVACEDVNNKFDGFDELTKPKNNSEVLHTIVDADITLIAKNLRANKNKEDSIIASTLLKDKMFSATTPVETTIPYVLKNAYYSKDAGSVAKVSYLYKGSVEGIHPDSIVSEAKNDLFIEDFQKLEAGTGVPVKGNGWIMKDLKGDYKWENRERNGTKYAQVSSFKSGGENEVWLITKSIDLSKLTDPLFSFDIVTGNYTAACLEIRISENFSGKDGEINNATWTNITSNFTLPAPATGYSEWASAGTFDLKAYKGKKAYIAFKYVGDDSPTASPKKTTTYQIDNVNVYEKQVISKKTTQFVFTAENGWIFDPTFVFDFEGNKPAYQDIVNYVKENQGVSNPKLIDSRGNAEFYYGFNAFYPNVTYRDKDRVYDPLYPVDGESSEKTAFMNQRVIEGLSAFLTVKHPDATPVISGIEQKAIIKNVLIYSDPSSTETNQYFTYTLQCVGNKEWKALTRQKAGQEPEDLTKK